MELNKEQKQKIKYWIDIEKSFTNLNLALGNMQFFECKTCYSLLLENIVDIGYKTKTPEKMKRAAHMQLHGIELDDVAKFYFSNK